MAHLVVRNDHVEIIKRKSVRDSLEDHGTASVSGRSIEPIYVSDLSANVWWGDLLSVS